MKNASFLNKIKITSASLIISDKLCLQRENFIMKFRWQKENVISSCEWLSWSQNQRKTFVCGIEWVHRPNVWQFPSLAQLHGQEATRWPRWKIKRKSFWERCSFVCHLSFLWLRSFYKINTEWDREQNHVWVRRWTPKEEEKILKFCHMKSEFRRIEFRTVRWLSF